MWPFIQMRRSSISKQRVENSRQEEESKKREAGSRKSDSQMTKDWRLKLWLSYSGMEK